MVTWSTIGMAALLVTGAPIVWRTLRSAARGHFATDIVASLSIVTAALLREPFAGLVIVLMQTGGEYLERYAARRATRALDELRESLPHVAHRVRGDDTEDVSIEVVQPGDQLAVRPGELIPADGVVTRGESWVDASRLTGESVPADVSPGAAVMSGSVNGNRPLVIRATARAEDSQYARIIQLVRSAQGSKAPLQRLADRYAVWFTPLIILVCVVTYAVSQDWTRVLAVLVVATPCPLILATPVAIVGGISHAARHGIIVRHGGALEALARVTIAVFDKTGTLTVGRPEVSRVKSVAPWTDAEVLRLAASVEEGSGHLLARSIVAAATRGNSSLPRANEVHETAGRGVAGVVEGRRVVVGARAFVQEKHAVNDDTLRRVENGAGLRAYVVVDGALAGTIEFADTIRPGATGTFARLKRAGVSRTMLLSGDQPQYVANVAATLGIAEARGNLLPADKVAVIEQLEGAGEYPLMVGDGVNDAPALSRAKVGMALAARGRGLATESADVILLEDELPDVAEAVEIGRKTMQIARQSILVGLGLSGIAMVAAAFGLITPVAGALLQEGIDVAVILNALRTSN